MPQVASALAAFGAFLASGTIAANIVTAILINIGLGSLEFRDDEGELWVAVDD